MTCIRCDSAWVHPMLFLNVKCRNTGEKTGAFVMILAEVKRILEADEKSTMNLGNLRARLRQTFKEASKDDKIVRLPENGL